MRSLWRCAFATWRVSHEGMLPFCHMGASDHFRVLQSGLARLLVAEAAGRPAGFALYTRCHLDRQPRPGLYLQAVYVCEDYRGLKVRAISRQVSTRGSLARQALATGCDHIKLIVHTDNEALSWYQRIGFQRPRGSPFFEMNDVDFVAGLVAAAEQPLPDGASLRLRPATAPTAGLICSWLAGRPLHLLANRPLNCACAPELAGCRIHCPALRETAESPASHFSRFAFIGKLRSNLERHGGRHRGGAPGARSGSWSRETATMGMPLYWPDRRCDEPPDACWPAASKLLARRRLPSVWPGGSAFLLYTPFVLHAQPARSPAFYVQSSLLGAGLRRHRVRLLEVLSRPVTELATWADLAGSSGFGHLSYAVGRVSSRPLARRPQPVSCGLRRRLSAGWEGGRRFRLTLRGPGDVRQGTAALTSACADGLHHGWPTSRACCGRLRQRPCQCLSVAKPEVGCWAAWHSPGAVISQAALAGGAQAAEAAAPDAAATTGLRGTIGTARGPPPKRETEKNCGRLRARAPKALRPAERQSRRSFS
uniref:N-acetyltransferase domain-containing protein n=1 Tax=Macrostomum lignano TaxID=282301 RepID=A0A1I8JNB2_9PLAT